MKELRVCQGQHVFCPKQNNREMSISDCSKGNYQDEFQGKHCCFFNGFRNLNEMVVIRCSCESLLDKIRGMMEQFQGKTLYYDLIDIFIEEIEELINKEK